MQEETVEKIIVNALGEFVKDNTINIGFDSEANIGNITVINGNGDVFEELNDVFELTVTILPVIVNALIKEAKEHPDVDALQGLHEALCISQELVNQAKD